MGKGLDDKDNIINNISPITVAIRVTDDKIYLNINRDKILPAFAHYMFEYRGIDYEGKTLVFKDCECKLVRKGLTSKWE